jgi:hypothetical protein
VARGLTVVIPAALFLFFPLYTPPFTAAAAAVDAASTDRTRRQGLPDNVRRVIG